MRRSCRRRRAGCSARRASAPPGARAARVGRAHVRQRASGRGYALGDVSDGDARSIATRVPAHRRRRRARACRERPRRRALPRLPRRDARGRCPAVDGARAYVLDGNGRRRSAPAARALGRAAADRPRSSGALRRGSTGSYAATGEERVLRGRAASRGSRWQLVVTAPRGRALRRRRRAPSRWIPWVILAIGAARAASASALLLRARSLRARATRSSRRVRTPSSRARTPTSSSSPTPPRTTSPSRCAPSPASASCSRQRYARPARRRGRRRTSTTWATASTACSSSSTTCSCTRASGARRSRDDARRPRRRARRGRSTSLEPAIARARRAGHARRRCRRCAASAGQLAQVLPEPHRQRDQVHRARRRAARPRRAPRATAARGGSPCATTGSASTPEQREQIFKMFGRLHPADALPGDGHRPRARASGSSSATAGAIWVEPARGRRQRLLVHAARPRRPCGRPAARRGGPA